MGIIIKWESKLERDFLYLLEFDPEVLIYREQPMRILYNFEGKIRRYTPDFLVVRKHKKQIIEVKPKDKVFRKNNARRFHIISIICQRMGYEFKVITDEMIRVQPRLKNIKLLWKYARTPIYPQHQIYCREIFSARREVRLGEVIRAFETKGIGRQVVFSMIYHRVLYVNPMLSINSESIIQFIGETISVG